MREEVAMVPDTKKTQENVGIAAQASFVGVSPHALLTSPIIIQRESSKKRKRKRYSSNTKDIQRLAFGLSRAVFRSTNSVAKGFKTFVKKSNKSARKRRDGLVREALRNASEGVSDGFAELGKAPGEVARRVRSGRIWRTFRILPIGG
jgi:hypothetical protein